MVLRAALDVLGRDRVLAVTAASDSVAQEELREARELAARLGAEHVVIRTSEFDDPNYLSNPQNRCYFCKTSLYTHMQRMLAERAGAERYVIVNGVNADDLGDWRPGIQAAKEFGVRSPMAEAGLTKAEVRDLSRRLDLPTSEKPASPCLSSRVQYGEFITPEKLRRIETCERLLHELGFDECRVRHHDNLARIEVPAGEVERICDSATRLRIIESFREAGYNYVTVDLQGFRSGSMNEVLSIGAPRGATGSKHLRKT